MTAPDLTDDQWDALAHLQDFGWAVGYESALDAELACNRQIRKRNVSSVFGERLYYWWLYKASERLAP